MFLIWADTQKLSVQFTFWSHYPESFWIVDAFRVLSRKFQGNFNTIAPDITCTLIAVSMSEAMGDRKAGAILY